jgi:tetratricopeptide (TPR) repeat protein
MSFKIKRLVVHIIFLSTATVLLADDPSLPKPGPGDPAGIQMELGLSSFAKGDLKAAEAAFTESLRLNPGLAGSMVGMAGVAAKKGDARQAESYFQKALAAAPQDPTVLRSWSRYLASQKRYGEAETSLKKAIALAPKAAAIPQTELGDLYLIALNKPADALRLYRAALTTDSGSGPAHYGAGSALSAMGDYPRAEVEFAAAQRTMPGDPMPIQAMGVVYMMQKKYPAAVQSFTRALALRPDQVIWLMARAEAYEALGDESRASKDYETCLKVDPKYAPAYVKIGVIHQLHDRFAEARKAYQSAISIDPKQALAYNNLAFGLAERKEQLDDALKWANKAVELMPESSQFQDTLGWVRRARGELAQASRILEKATTLKPALADVYYHLGIVYSELGRPGNAGEALKKALAMGPLANADDARQRLARLTSK